MNLKCVRPPLILILIVGMGLLFDLISGNCPNLCSHHGTCDIYGACACASGWQGADCSEKICPFSNAWADEATATDFAHNPSECSNKGICDRALGKCICQDGITGHACERLECLDECNSQGRCVSMHDLASRSRDEFSQKFTYYNPPHTQIAWDSNKIHGCICDTGLFGYDCSKKVCPQGDDPLTLGQVNEKQLLKCTGAVGSFALFYNGIASTFIPYSASAKNLEEALLTIPAIKAVKITFSQGHSAHICQTINPNIVTVEFTQQFGPQHPLVPQISDELYGSGGSVVVAAHGDTLTDDHGRVLVSVMGTKENDMCSNRGICDLTDGQCTCFNTNGDSYSSSNGYSAAGSRGDCGWVSNAGNSAVKTCPGELQCSGHGTCDSETLKCTCSEGWEKGDCSHRSCKEGHSWFSYPQADNFAHSDYAECSNMGHCDYARGTCECRPGFYGEACEYMACDGGIEMPCSGHGVCMTMAELAYNGNNNGDAVDYVYGQYPNHFHTTWDAHRIHGCQCDEGFEGYDCSLRKCPIGDDAGTYDDHVEVQLLRCRANAGNFSLSFRQAETRVLPFDVTAAELRDALHELTTIYNINVYFGFDYSPPNGTLNWVKPVPIKFAGGYKPWGYYNSNGTYKVFEIIDQHNINATSNSTFCHSDGTQTAIVEFRWTHGNLPSIIPNYAYLGDYHNSNGAPGSGTLHTFSDGESINGLTSIQGTTETAVCNNRGLCDQTTGNCKCFPDWTSGDGRRQGGPGATGDCGYRDNMHGAIMADKSHMWSNRIVDNRGGRLGDFLYDKH